MKNPSSVERKQRFLDVQKDMLLERGAESIVKDIAQEVRRED